MDIRTWFGLSHVHDKEQTVNQIVESLLVLLSKSLKSYLKIDYAKNVQDLLRLARKQNLMVGEELFLNWFEVKGLPTIQETLSRDIPDHQELKARLEYEYYILEEEMNMNHPEDLRACMINIVNGLPESIAVVKEITATEECLLDFWEPDEGIFEEFYHEIPYSHEDLITHVETYNYQQEPALHEQVLFFEAC